MAKYKDPHMKSPLPKYLLIIVVVALLVFLVAPKLYEIYNDNLDETNERANEA